MGAYFVVEFLEGALMNSEEERYEDGHNDDREQQYGWRSPGGVANLTVLSPETFFMLRGVDIVVSDEQTSWQQVEKYSHFLM